MIYDLDHKVVERFLATPASRFALVLSQIVRSALTAAIQAVIILLVSLALGVRIHTGAAGWVVIIVAAILVNAVFAGLSQAIALLTRREATMIAVANFIGLPLLFLSSTMIALSQMPGWMQTASKFNPVDWGVRAARDVVLPADVVERRRLAPPAACSRTRCAHRGWATYTFRMYQRTPLALLALDDRADRLADRDRLQRGDRELGDRSGAVGGHLVLHLHRLDDAHDLARLDASPSATFTSSTVPCIGLTTESEPPAAPAAATRSRRRRASSRYAGSGTSTFTSTRRPSTSIADTRSTDRRLRGPAVEPRVDRRARRRARRAPGTRRRRGTSHRRGSTDARGAPGGTRRASSRRRSGTPRARAASAPIAASRSAPWTISLAIIGS